MGSTLFDMTDQVAVITGSTKGIGRAIAERFIDHGARVTISSRLQKECESLADTLNEAAGRDVALAKACDITDANALRGLVDVAATRWGRIDSVVCNAAYVAHGSTAETSDEAFLNSFLGNVVNSARLCDYTLPHFLKQGGGSVVFISSIAALLPTPALAAYGTTKRAMLQLMLNLAAQWARHNVRLNAVVPGYTRSESTRAVLENAKARELVTATIPLGRFAEPDEIAAAVVFLASRGGAYVTGQTLVVDGGFSTRGSSQSGNAVAEVFKERA